MNLKPCPFCGGEAHIHHRNNAPEYCVVCEDKKCLGHSVYHLFYTEEKAAEAWNRRAGGE